MGLDDVHFCLYQAFCSVDMTHLLTIIIGSLHWLLEPRVRLLLLQGKLNINSKWFISIPILGMHSV